MTRPRIDVFRPSCGIQETHAVARVFDSGWLGKGTKVAEFEAAWAAHIGVDPAHVASVNSATEGLFQVCDLAGIGPGDIVFMPSIHFIGAANAVMSRGARIVFCDVDPHTLNLTLETLQKAYKVIYAKAVMLLHYGGVAQELDDIRAWCNTAGLTLIEDAACAQATRHKDKAAGTYGSFGVWSFDAMKIATCGDGGMIYVEDASWEMPRLNNRLYLGMNEQSGLSSDKERWWEFSVNEYALGRRSIMNDIAASIGLEQLKKLPGYVERRLQIVEQYTDALCDIVDLPTMALLQGAPYYFYWIQTPRRDELAKYLRSHGVYCTFRYYPLHRVFRTGQHLPGADYAADNTLLLPLHQGLTDDDVQFVCDKVKEFFV